MKQTFQQKVSYYLVLGLVSLIILGFLFTGYTGAPGSVGGSTNTIGSVEGIPVKAREWQTVYNQQLQFYSQFSGGKPLTRKQIESFGVEKRVRDIIVNQKLLIKLADNLNVHSSEKELAKEIKDLPYFKTNEKFDVQRYKTLLKANGITTAEFEEETSNNLRIREVNDSIVSYPVSNSYAKEIFNLKNNGIEAHVVHFRNANLKKYIEVSSKEINDFIKDENNKQIIENLYNRNISKYTLGDERKARHILIKTTEKRDDAAAKEEIEKIAKELTPKNFAELAKKYSEDSSNTKGGDLGWFGRGRMVKPFEDMTFSLKKGEISKPVKSRFGYHIIMLDDLREGKVTPLKDVQNRLVKEHLQNNNSEEKTKELVAKITKDIESALKNNKIKELEKIQKKYGLTFLKNTKIDQYNLKAGSIDIELETFNKLKDGGIVKVEEATEQLIAKKINTFSTDDIKDKDNQLKNEVSNISRNLGSQINGKILKVMEENASIKGDILQI